MTFMVQSFVRIIWHQFIIQCEEKLVKTKRRFSTAEGVQYCRRIASVLQKLFSTVGGSHSTAGYGISTVEGWHQYCGEIATVLWGMASVLWSDSISTAEAVQYPRSSQQPPQY